MLTNPITSAIVFIILALVFLVQNRTVWSKRRPGLQIPPRKPNTSKVSWVKVQNLASITLHANKWTIVRRTVPSPQLICIAGCHHAGSTLNTVKCTNPYASSGTFGPWHCTLNEALRTNGYTFSYTDVSCEMYSYKDVTGKNVTLILVGSCALTVSI